jgi:hypothetical protein
LLAAPHASQHCCPQIAVNPSLISGAFGFVEGEHIGIDAQASELLDGAIEAAPDGVRPICDLRCIWVACVDFVVRQGCSCLQLRQEIRG